MRRFLAGSLGVSFGLWAGVAGAGDAPAPAANQQTPPVRAVLGTPVAILGRPVPLPVSSPGDASKIPVVDRQVTPASFTPPPMAWNTVVRGQEPDTSMPLPIGPSTDAQSPTTAKKQQGRAAKETPELLQQMPTPAETSAPFPGAPGVVPFQGPPGAAPFQGHPGAGPVAGVPGTVTPDECEGGAFAGDNCCGPFGCRPFWGCACTDVNNFMWFEGDYLLWWIKGNKTPPLVTTSPAGTPVSSAGVLGAPGTQVLFGGGNPDMGEFSGGRFTLGFWLDPNHCFAIDSTTFFLGSRSTSFSVGSDGSTILARPFTSVVTAILPGVFVPTSPFQASELVSFPGLLAGNVGVRQTSQLWGTDLNFRANLWNGCRWRVDGLLGARLFGLDENLTVTENLTALSNGQTFTVVDSFSTHNFFAGGQLGLDVGWHVGCWSIDLLGKVALGNMHEAVTINGYTTLGSSGPLPGGLLTAPTNIGHFSRDQFAVLPEACLKLGYQITPRIKAFVGYNFLYASNVIRPGNVIDTTVNVSQLPGGPGLIGQARPSILYHGSDFWAQGISIGLEFKF
jgi:hypothetical protein